MLDAIVFARRIHAIGIAVENGKDFLDADNGLCFFCFRDIAKVVCLYILSLHGKFEDCPSFSGQEQIRCSSNSNTIWAPVVSTRHDNLNLASIDLYAGVGSMAKHLSIAGIRVPFPSKAMAEWPRWP